MVAGCAFAATACARKEAAAGRAAGPPVQPVEVIPVTRRDLVETLNVVGSLAPNESAQIRAEIAGQVRAIHFHEGQRVEQGQVLLKIDDAELQAQLAQTEARFKLAELNLARAENLRQTRSSTAAEYDRAQSEFATTKAELALLRVRLEKTEIKAPFAGVVGARAISPGDYADTSKVIATIADLSRLKVDFQVPERFLGKLRVGTTFTVKSKALVTDAPVQGEVYFVDAVIDRDTRSSEVKGYLDNPPPALQAGMFANIELVLEVRRAVLTVPEGAVLVSPQGTQLILVQDRNGEKVAAFLPVRLGLRARGLVEVAPVQGDLPEGQSVVASGVGGLVIYPGARLEPRPLREEFRVGD
jgi:membrane fusion protein (multidrug efflux system)